MKLPVKVKLKQLRKETLFEAYKKEEVLAYCQKCNNYGKNYSCPDFKFDTVKYLESYNYATIIMAQIDTEPIKAQMDRFKIDNFPSRVMKNYIKDKKNKGVDISSAISMYAFNYVKDQITHKLIEIEKDVDNTLGLPPGSCTKCITCLKQQGKPCVYPETLRYSLEALGFMVSDIYKQCFNLELGWSKGVLPEAFYSCSALMTKEKISEAMILDKLDGIILDINED